jgi:hypothetical protein
VAIRPPKPRDFSNTLTSALSCNCLARVMPAMPAPMIARDFIVGLHFLRFEWVSYGRLTDLDECLADQQAGLAQSRVSTYISI